MLCSGADRSLFQWKILNRGQREDEASGDSPVVEQVETPEPELESEPSTRGQMAAEAKVKALENDLAAAEKRADAADDATAAGVEHCTCFGWSER